MSTRATLKQLLEKYYADHTHPMNKATHMVGIPMIIASLFLFFVDPMLALGLFVVGWVLQFIGHAFEGNMPSFFSDPRFLLVGPMFIARKWRAVFGRGGAPSAAKRSQ